MNRLVIWWVMFIWCFMLCHLIFILFFDGTFMIHFIKYYVILCSSSFFSTLAPTTFFLLCTLSLRVFLIFYDFDYPLLVLQQFVIKFYDSFSSFSVVSNNLFLEGLLDICPCRFILEFNSLLFIFRMLMILVLVIVF